MKKIAVLGSTGSIGVNTLGVISELPESEFRITALSANSNMKLLAQQIKKFRPKMVCAGGPERINELKKLISLKRIKLFCGIEGLQEIAASRDVDLVVMAILGNAALTPLLKAVESGKTIALASKEPLVSAGRIITKKAEDNQARIIPVDSEHSAVFQCLAGRKNGELKKIFLTGSGGPLRNTSRRLFNSFSPARIVKHPKWKMGRKISVDSATLMNKGLEVIEAMHLFGVGVNDIEVLIHPEAIVHSMVELKDGAVLAQMALPDMRLPIRYALTFPERRDGNLFGLNFRDVNRLTFFAPDKKKFPCLRIAYEAARKGGTYPAVLNAANEIAVDAYLKGKLKFTRIPIIIEKVIRRHSVVRNPKLKDILEVDGWAREETKRSLRAPKGRSNDIILQ